MPRWLWRCFRLLWRQLAMSEAVLVAFITGVIMLIGNIIAAYYNNQKTLYRIEQLEKKQDKYNNLQERTLAAEKDIKHIYYEIDEMKRG